MKHLLQRHPVPMRTRFAHSLVLTYALPPQVLEPLLPPGLALDTYTDPAGTEHGFVAAALVDTRDLRPAFLPAGLGADLILTGYRIFTRFPTPGGRTMRGLKILRSDTDSRTMAVGGNLLTRYHYRLARIGSRVVGDTLEFRVLSRDGRADLHVRADLAGAPADLPAGSPFACAKDARRFAGPLPYTFEHEPRTGSMIVVKAVRTHWEPTPVAVELPTPPTFFQHGPFAGTAPVLANAFHVADLDYGWDAGLRRAENGAER
ncbi:DUF2071 domain-containing protein [Kitasatospora cineracea]|uniref:Uncharacterized protein DUF2071 n=1 Tax=Kitasatospora cineracea TaxID=88074 RepID=A0A8G1X836_9ACTN|nr:DUF2071 domain-containing protein [Kitasatospora cineracea]ROR35428.1 uncharacterized protein DUF2071 [Kitasatospora cineracea]